MLYDDVFLQRKAIMAIIDFLGAKSVYRDGRRRRTKLQAALTHVKATLLPFMSVSQLRRWWDHFLQFGDTPAERRRAARIKYKPAYVRRTNRGHWKCRHTTILKQIVDAHPDYYLDEIQAKFAILSGEVWSCSMLWRNLQTELNYSLQVCVDKANQQDQAEVAAYFNSIDEFMVQPEQLVFVDESQKDRNSSRRRRSWARRGIPPFRNGYLAEHHRKRYTFIGACDINGFIIEACDTVERESGANDNDPTHGTVNGERFKLWVEEKLLPVLGN